MWTWLEIDLAHGSRSDGIERQERQCDGVFFRVLLESSRYSVLCVHVVTRKRGGMDVVDSSVLKAL